jgi:glycerate 2-kinase
VAVPHRQAASTALVAPDKFKGCLDAAAVAAALGAGLASAGVPARTLALADGGDGSVAAAVSAGYRGRPVTVAGATGLPRTAEIALCASGAVVEVANSCGLSTLPGRRLDPLDSSSLGFGQAIRHALTHEPSQVVLALGGSASTDGGIGMLVALGYVFRDIHGRPVHPCGRTLGEIVSVDATHAVPFDDVHLVIAGDVTNPLLGHTGAATVYGPQKGADPAMVTHLDHGLRHLVEVLAHNGFPRARELAASAGAGAAGGIGFAAMLLGAHATSGADFFLDLLDFDKHCTASSFLVTGEGSIDEQSVQGKLLSALIRRCGDKPVIGVGGRSTLGHEERRRFGLASVYTLAERTSANTADDPALSRDLLTDIGHEIGIAAGAGLFTVRS